MLWQFVLYLVEEALGVVLQISPPSSYQNIFVKLLSELHVHIINIIYYNSRNIFRRAFFISE